MIRVEIEVSVPHTADAVMTITRALGALDLAGDAFATVHRISVEEADA